ncbi:LuxR C-terminal-related transcriptional regulator [Conexibacter sp. CPCC 206217]|uniref:LuxR C-terminal-related transcriptional regulator n=1 Tax=Conexibacter sp. CPCC 206217 TaxID=3064574 RepID=UPI00351C1165
MRRRSWPGWRPRQPPRRRSCCACPAGSCWREIASELGVSANTVKTDVSAIYRKFGVGTRPEAIARARELGLLGGGAWER